MFLLSIFYMSGTVVGARDMAVEKLDRNMCLMASILIQIVVRYK